MYVHDNGEAGDDWGDFPASPGPNRRPAVRGRVTGHILEWKHKFGWIKPDKPIDHPEAFLKGGKVFLSQDDVAEVISGVGAHVSFYVYADGSGLGALECMPSESATAKVSLKPKVVPKPKSKLVPKAQAKAASSRKRVSDEPLTGRVKAWKGGFGFVTPNEPLDHPLFTGSVYLHASDVLTPSGVEAGAEVTFFLYADPQGLGAEECSLLESGASEASPGGGGDSEPTLLRAKPKAAAAALAAAAANLLPPPSPTGGVLVKGYSAPTPKGKAMMKATPKAPSTAKVVDDQLAKKMSANPELAKRLHQWLFDPGG